MAATDWPCARALRPWALALCTLAGGRGAAWHLASETCSSGHSPLPHTHQYELAERSLLQREILRTRRGVLLNSGGGGWQPSGWYGAFDEAESTYDADAFDGGPEFPDHGTAGGVGYEVPPPPRAVDELKAGGKAAEWFDESKSGGPREAWQTHFPALGDSAAHPLGEAWRSSNGKWEEAYKPSKFSPESAWAPQLPPAAWFDTIVDHVDAYGRRLLPDRLSGRTYIEWEKRTRSANLTCVEPGCVALASLQVFDALTERARQCQLNLGVYPTDFEDDFSHELVEGIANTATGEMLSTKCDPMIRVLSNQRDGSGCNAAAQSALFPCLSNHDVQKMIGKGNGTLHLAVKNSEMVDECPKDGFLLNGVVTVTCFVAPLKHQLLPTPAPKALGSWSSCPLRCEEKGCMANCTMRLSQLLVQDKVCRLTVTVNQTDFDGDHGSVEMVEGIMVDGEVVAEGISPGKNPCKAKADGTPLAPADMVFTAVDGADVTEAAADGELVVYGKITERVDECGSNGFLFDAMATVNCTGPDL